MKTKHPLPRLTWAYGAKVSPTFAGDTWIEGEMMCSDYGQFRRRAYVRHAKTNKMVLCRATLPDTYFSIPATTKTESGYITGGENEFIFQPYADQKESPAEFRKRIKQGYALRNQR